MRRRVTVLVLCMCLYVCVCVSVTILASTSFVSTFQIRYVQLSFRLYSIFVQKLWREKANMQMSISLPRAPMAPMQRHLARIFEDRAFSDSFKVERSVTSYQE